MDGADSNCYYSIMLPAQPNRSLIDGLSVLQGLASRAEPIGGLDLARELGIEPTRAHRLLKTLSHLGLARQDDRRRYAVGPAVHVLAAQSLRASGLIQSAIAPLESLHELGYIVAMGVLWRTEVCYVYFATPGASTAEALGSRAPHPATSSGLGLALLATLPNTEVRQRYENRPTPGCSDLDELLELLQSIRRNGYAVCTAGRAQGQATLATTVGGPAYAAIGLAGHLDMRRRRRLIDALKTAAHQIIQNDTATPSLSSTTHQEDKTS